MEKICIYSKNLTQYKPEFKYLKNTYSSICENKLDGKFYFTVYHGKNDIFVNKRNLDKDLENNLKKFLITEWKINNFK